VKNLNKVAVIVVCALSLSGLAFSQKVFSIVAVPGSTPNTAIAINNYGQVVVNTGTSSSYKVTLWNRVSGAENIGLIGTSSGGMAVSDTNQVVGAGDADSLGYLQAFIWQSTTGLRWLGSLGGNYSAANGVNASGTVVGVSNTGTNTQHAFVWTAAAGMQDLTADLTSVGGATAIAVNATNQVVGYYYPNGTRTPVGFLWTQTGGLQNLGSTGTLPFAINNSGTVVGQSAFASGARHAFSWTEAGGITDLGTLGGSQSAALSINKLGWIAGTSLSTGKSGLVHGFLWTPTDGMKDLTVLAGLGATEQAYSIELNDSGVVAVSTNKGSFLLVPKITGKFTSSQNPSVVGQSVTLTASLTSVAGAPPDGDTVTFSVGSKVLGSAVLNGGVAEFTTAALVAGKNSIVVNFNGDANYTPTKFTALAQVVNP
jgi:probable HAF family extracellular repeat protein